MSALPLHEFNTKFASYRGMLREEVLRFCEDVYVYRQIQERKNDSLAVLNMAPAFFNITERALFSSIIIWADKLFDEKGQRGLFDFLTFIEYNRKWLTAKQLQVRKQYPDGHWMLRDRIPLTTKTIAEHRNRIRELASLESFKILRDKYHGHFDREYFFDRSKLNASAPLQWSDLIDSGEVMGDIINYYSVDFDGISFSWTPLNIDDLDALIEKATRKKIKR